MSKKQAVVNETLDQYNQQFHGIN